MDALRRAEEAKRMANPAPASSGEASRSNEWRLDPLENPSSAPERPLPRLSEHLELLDADLASAATAPLRPKREPAPAGRPVDALVREAAERTAARNMFAVKQAPQSKTALWLFLGLFGVSLLAIGGYFAWQLLSLSGGSLSGSVNTGAAGGAHRPVAATPPAPAAAENVSLLPQPTVVPADPPGKQTPPADTGTRAANNRPQATVTSANGPAFMRSGHPPVAVDTTLMLAYEAWQEDRLDDARRGYEQVLRRDPRNGDALLGVAAIAARQGNVERARDYYNRVLESHPGDATAHAALISLQGSTDVGQLESRLKTLLENQPESSALHAAQGNLYARLGRWGEAQEAYFQAYSREPDNADVLFNLAVSLDHLRQPQLAAQYYRMALSAAETRRAAFDRNAAYRRLLELQP